MAMCAGLTSVDEWISGIAMSCDGPTTNGAGSATAMYPISPLTPTATGCRVVLVPEREDTVMDASLLQIDY